MSAKMLAGAGALLLLGGIAVFLFGAFVLTKNARRGNISPAVYAGVAMAGTGLLGLGIAGLVAIGSRPKP